MKKRVNIVQFKKWLEKVYGKKCPDYCYGCPNCRLWRLYEELESFLEEHDDCKMTSKHLKYEI
jgi:hypothetical protein